MATLLVCDICGAKDGIETVRLTVENRVLEIDLCQNDLGKMTEKAREVAKKRGRPRGSTTGRRGRPPAESPGQPAEGQE